jgi:hypothetical protein
MSECIICLENEMSLSKNKTLVCGHQFHESCINSWISIHNNCPLCRRYIHSTENINGHYSSYITYACLSMIHLMIIYYHGAPQYFFSLILLFSARFILFFVVAMYHIIHDIKKIIVDRYIEFFMIAYSYQLRNELES